LSGLRESLEYRCVVCGRPFPSKWALRGHLRVHRGELVDFNVRIPRATRDQFKVLCETHGVTTCHMVMSIMHALSEAFRRGVNFEFDVRTEEMRMKEGKNPIIVNLSQTFLGKPRSAWKTPVSTTYMMWPPSCEFADDFHKGSKEVGCLRSKEWTRLVDCWSCFQRGNHGP